VHSYVDSGLSPEQAVACTTFEYVGRVGNVVAVICRVDSVIPATIDRLYDSSYIWTSATCIHQQTA
jgi:hypothetical protein